MSNFSKSNDFFEQDNQNPFVYLEFQDKKNDEPIDEIDTHVNNSDGVLNQGEDDEGFADDVGIIHYSNVITESTIKEHELQMELKWKQREGSTDSAQFNLNPNLGKNDGLFMAQCILEKLPTDSEYSGFGPRIPLGMAAIDFARAHPHDPSKIYEYKPKSKAFWIRFIHGLHRRISFLLPTPLKKVKQNSQEKASPIAPSEEEKQKQAAAAPEENYVEINLN